MQSCPKCGSQMILENEVPKCIFCFGKQSVVKSKHQAKDAKDPGEAGLAMVSGKAMQVPNHPTPYIKGTAKVVAVQRSIYDALDIMRSMPMPKDIKEFRKIQKIIKLMEDITGENNDAA